MDPMRRVASLALALGVLASLVTPASASVDCSVTIPNREPLPPGHGAPPSNEGARPGDGGYLHGNGAVWAWVPEDGIYVVESSQVKPDGSVDIKWYWWRRVERVDDEGAHFLAALRVEGTHLDGSEAVDTRLHPYNNGAFQGTTVTIPTSGCYELTGSAGGEALTFTVLVLLEGQPLPDTASSAPATSPIVLAGVGLVMGGMLLALVLARYNSPPRESLEPRHFLDAALEPETDRRA